MASFRTAILVIACMVLVLESTTGQPQPFAPEKLHEATQVKQILLERCSKGWKWLLELQPTPYPLPQANITQKCSAGEPVFGDRLVVVAQHKEDITHLAKYLEPPFLVYTAGDLDTAHSADNIGNEVGPYLTFIAEYYNCLPMDSLLQTVLLAHAHRASPVHSSNSLDYDANNVNWDKVPGFAPKHRLGLWHELRNIHDPDLSWQHPLQKNLTPAEARALPCDKVHEGVAYEAVDAIQHTHGFWVRRAWEELFGPAGLGPLPDAIRASVAAEMFVTADAVRAHPREFYLQALQWMVDSCGKGLWNRWSLGGVFELTWHIIFGQPAWMAGLPIPECELYRCNATAAFADRVQLHKSVQAASQERLERNQAVLAALTAPDKVQQTS